MDSSQSILPIRCPGIALSSVTEFVGSGQIIPCPVTALDTDLMSELSPEKLKSLTGSDDLDQVTTFEMCVDIRENTMGNIGVYLPKLVQLKMNNSLILSVRDLGTTLSHIQVLSLVRCGLADLDGISLLPSLKELYMAYNNVSDLSQVGMLEKLELLDLEGNNVDDLVQVQYLGLCGQLRTLSLVGNPVCTCPHLDKPEVSDYNYRAAVRMLIPQLHCLDDAPAEEVELRCSSTPMEDETVLKESIKDSASITDSATGSLEEERAVSVCGLSRPCSAQRPGTSLSFSGISSRPASARPHSSSSDSRPGSATSEHDTLEDKICDITHGVGSISFCGNPVQAVRARRKKIKHKVPNSHSRPCTQLGTYVPEHTYDVEETSSQDRSDVFAELRAWREEHSKRLLAIEQGSQPQIMKIVHSDNDTGDNDDIEDDDDENNEDNCSLPDTGAVSPDVSRLSYLSDHTQSPSPPSRDTAPSTSRRITEIRARRLRVSTSGVGAQEPTGEILLPNKSSIRRDTFTTPASAETMNIQSAPLQLLHKPHRPDASSKLPMPREPCSGPPGRSSLSINEQGKIICSITPQRPTPTRPHTARASLQRHAGHRTLLPGRGSPHLD